MVQFDSSIVKMGHFSDLCKNGPVFSNSNLRQGLFRSCVSLAQFSKIKKENDWERTNLPLIFQLSQSTPCPRSRQSRHKSRTLARGTTRRRTKEVRRRARRRHGLEREPTRAAQGKASGLGALRAHRRGSTDAGSTLRRGARWCTRGRGTGETRQGYEVRIISRSRAHVNESYPMHETGSAYCGLHETK
jgi:hypothetical protein